MWYGAPVLLYLWSLILSSSCVDLSFCLITYAHNYLSTNFRIYAAINFVAVSKWLVWNRKPTVRQWITAAYIVTSVILNVIEKTGLLKKWFLRQLMKHAIFLICTFVYFYGQCCIVKVMSRTVETAVILWCVTNRLTGNLLAQRWRQVNAVSWTLN